MVIGVIVLPAALVTAWWCFFRRLPSLRRAERLAYTGMATAAQLVLSQTALGMVGWLTGQALLVVNALVVAAVSAYLLRARPVAAGAPASRLPARELLSPAVMLLLALLALVAVWLGLAAWFLPPRGVDDLIYHLPQLYQYAQTGRISVLPLDLRDVFAMPFNADLLYLWPLLFADSDRLVDGLQFVAALYAALVVYALACRWGAGRREAAFVGLSILFIPVVLGQAGTNYVDVILAAAYLFLLLAIVTYRDTGEIAHVWMAGLAAGFLLGAKYTFVPLVVLAQPLLIGPLCERASVPRAAARLAGSWLCALPLFAYWYLRNWAATGYPLFPFQFGGAGLTGVPGTQVEEILTSRGASALATFATDPWSFLRYPFADPGLGSLHGGFGLVFWGLGLPALLYCLLAAVRSASRRALFVPYFWAQWLLVFLAYLATVRAEGMQYDQRYIIAVVGLGLVALGMVLTRLQRCWPSAAAVIKGACIASALLAVMQMGSYIWPTYSLQGPLADARSGEFTSQYRYYRQGRNSPGALAELSVAWEPLDYLTAEGSGWRVYMAADWGRFITAPLFGSRLQNRVWNFMAKPEGEPDAVVFGPATPNGNLSYVGEVITPLQIRSAGRYELVTQTETVEFWVSRRLLEQAPTRARLAEYYRRAFGWQLPAVAALIGRCPADATLLTGAPAGPGLNYLSLTGKIDCPVVLVRPGLERAEAKRRDLDAVITIGSPLPGYESRLLADVRDPALSFRVFENRQTR